MQKKIDYSIRAEKYDDYEEIYRLIQTAFMTAKVKDGDEQDFAVSLRESENYIQELGLVAEINNSLIGHIMLTKTTVVQSDGTLFQGLLLAPVSVLLEYRDRGVGSSLIREGLHKAKEMGYTAVFLCGDPAYYNRFGFKQTSLYNIYSSTGIPDQYVMVCELVPDALKGIEGKVNCC